jgi:DNA-binding response OmpR family regulator
VAEILIIEDNALMRSAMTRVLESAGHHVLDAADGATGMKLFRDARPALVITDIVMPGQEGMETIRLLRQHSPNVPILAISGGGWQDYLGFAKELGADETLRKPFPAEELLAAVAKLLANEAIKPD